MRILALADEPDQLLWGPAVRRLLEGVDLILSCGDLPAAYLSYLVTFSKAPLLYVHGNHDAGYLKKPPEGCICIDDTLYRHNGLRILGLGGSMRYNSESPFQYTGPQMDRRVARRWLDLRRAGGVDILLTHAPAQGLGDGTDLAHQGFPAFRKLLERWSPAYLVHGHVHLSYDYKLQRMTTYQDTRILNAYQSHVFEFTP